MSFSKVTVSANKYLGPDKYRVKIRPYIYVCGYIVVFDLIAQINESDIRYHGQVSLLDKTATGQNADNILKEYFIHPTRVPISDLERTVYSREELIKRALDDEYMISKFMKLFETDTINRYEMKENHMIDENTATCRIVTYYKGMGIDIVSYYDTSKFYLDDRTICYGYIAEIKENGKLLSTHKIDNKEFYMSEEQVGLYSVNDRLRHIFEVFIIPSIQAYIDNGFIQNEVVMSTRP
jgi:hypothetical protein